MGIATRRPANGLFSWPLLLWLSLAILLQHANFAAADCGASFDFPVNEPTFYFQDTINVQYTSNFSAPVLKCWCDPSDPQQRFQTSPPPFNGTQLVVLDWISGVPCWFELLPDSLDCDDNSTQFNIRSTERAQATTLGLAQPTSTMAIASSTSPSSPIISATAQSTSVAASSSDGMSSGARIGLGIGIAIAGIATGVLAAAIWFRYQRRRKSRRGFPHSEYLAAIGPAGGNLHAEKQYPPSRPTAGGMAATITHRGDFDWQNIGEGGYDDPAKAPLSPNLNSIGPVGYYGQVSEDGASSTRSRSRGADHQPRPYSWGSSPEEAAQSGSSGDVAGLPTYASAIHADGDKKGPSRAHECEAHADTAELPTNDAFAHPAGEEFELPTQASYKPHHSGGRDVDEQKFLLSDVEMVKLRDQKRRRRGDGDGQAETSREGAQSRGQGG